MLEFTVKEISNQIGSLLKTNFSNVVIRGEISGYKGPSSTGHVYFSLKEEDLKIDAVIWRSKFSRLTVKPEEGMQVLAFGSVSSYAAASRYNFVIESIKPDGIGDLMQRYEQLKQQLKSEGLFEEKYKKPLPNIPKIIGVVTSAKGAVIRDIIHRISERYPSHVLLYDAAVQGVNCANEVAAGINAFNKLTHLRPEVIIVARGGGSLEDLYGYNDEKVIRAAFASDIPIISAIGHETDYSLLDFVADKRAPTPTAAAEIVVPVREELMRRLKICDTRLFNAMSRNLESAKHKYKSILRGYPSLVQLLASYWMRFEDILQKLNFKSEKIFITKQNICNNLIAKLKLDLLTKIITIKKDKLEDRANYLNAVSYQSVLQRGFALLLNEEGEAISRKANIEYNKPMKLLLVDGEVKVIAQK